MKERIKEIRKSNNLTQTSFAKTLGVSRDKIANIESGRVEADDSFIMLISKTYLINENWIKTGNGEMLINSESTKNVIDMFENLNEDFQNYVIKQLEDLIELQKKKENQ